MPLILGANSVSGGYEIDNSLRFNSGSTDYLNRTPAGAGSLTSWTWSGWIKRSTLGVEQAIFFGDSTTTNYGGILFPSGNTLDFVNRPSGGVNARLLTTQVFRDVSAWYHIVAVWNTSSATSGDRLILYVNGVRITNFSTETYPSQNTSSVLNTAIQHELSGYIGANGGSFASGFNGYMSEVYFIDGQALTPSSFGETDEDTNIWKPIPYTGTFGTNGFYLKFQNSSALGTDSSGNGNTWTVNNLTSIDQTTDTPTNNFCTMNNLSNNNASLAFTNGNLEVTSSAQWLGSTSTLAVSQGKWYWEVKYISGNFGFGIGKIGTSATATVNLSSANNGYVGKYPDGYEYFRNGANSQKINNNSTTSYGTQASANDILMVAFNADIGAIWVGRNGTWYASATQAEIEAGTTTNAMYSGITINDFFTPTGSFENGALQYNFGSPPFTISSGNADANGYGNFEYAVPSGYYSLCTKNLAEYA